MRRRSTASGFALALLVALTGCATAPAPLPGTTREPHVVTLDPRTLLSDAALARQTDAGEPGCSAAVGLSGEVAWAGAGGVADTSTEVPLTTASRFDLASVSKQFTATAVLLLEREGALSLDDPVGAHVSGLPGWGQSVTLEELLHQTSRLPDFWVQLDEQGIGFADRADFGTILEAIRRIPATEPGEGFLYSNTNYVLLAAVVREAGGQSLEAFLAERVFGPLELAMVLDPRLEGDDVPTPYEVDGSVARTGWSAVGAVGIHTSPSELVRWADQYRTGELVDPDVETGSVSQGDNGLRYGPGLDLAPDGTIGHDGRFGGFVSSFLVSADRGTAIAVLCNGRGTERFPLMEELRTIWMPTTPP